MNDLPTSATLRPPKLKTDPENSLLFGIVLMVVVCGLFLAGIYLVRHFRTPPKPPPPAVLKCPHCGKDVPLRVATPEDDRAATEAK